jgi:hypothetical protein
MYTWDEGFFIAMGAVNGIKAFIAINAFGRRLG